MFFSLIVFFEKFKSIFSKTNLRILRKIEVIVFKNLYENTLKTDERKVSKNANSYGCL